MSEATKAEYRQRLLDAAAAEFAAKGLEGARVDDISLAAGLAKGTIYNYFDSKNDVFRSVIEQWSKRISDVREVLPEDRPIREQLMSFLTADMQVTGEMEEFAKTAFREVLTAPPGAMSELVPEYDPVDIEIEKVIARAQTAGELRSDRAAQELARFFVSLMNGFLLEHWFPKSELRLEDIPELVLDYYLDGARA